MVADSACASPVAEVANGMTLRHPNMYMFIFICCCFPLGGILALSPSGSAP